MNHDDTATILVVEDDDATRTFLADNLTADGFELLVADCARDGARLMETKFPDLALIDVGLPDGSGLDLMRELRQRYGLRGICLSGFGMEDDLARSADAGFTRHLTKPVDLDKLQAAIDTIAG